MVICPRCNKQVEVCDALSRKDNKTPICVDCEIDEAIREYRNLPPIEF